MADLLTSPPLGQDAYLVCPWQYDLPPLSVPMQSLVHGQSSFFLPLGDLLCTGCNPSNNTNSLPGNFSQRYRTPRLSPQGRTFQMRLRAMTYHEVHPSLFTGDDGSNSMSCSMLKKCDSHSRSCWHSCGSPVPEAKTDSENLFAMQQECLYMKADLSLKCLLHSLTFCSQRFSPLLISQR